MDPQFETWFMRGLVAMLLICLGWFIKREVSLKDKAFSAQQKEIERFKQEFSDSLEKMANRFTVSLDGFNVTLASLANALTDLKVTLAKEYVTWDDLREQYGERRATSRGEQVHNI